LPFNNLQISLERLAVTRGGKVLRCARGGELFCELVGDRVKIGGNATLYLKGEIYVEEARSDAAAI